MQPTRHAYAALLLEQGHVEEACKAYTEDLDLDTSLPHGHQVRVRYKPLMLQAHGILAMASASCIAVWRQDS